MGAPPIEYESVQDKKGQIVPKMNARAKVADCVSCGHLMCRDYLKIVLGRSIPALIKNIWKQRLRQFGKKLEDGRHMCDMCTNGSKSLKPCN